MVKQNVPMFAVEKDITLPLTLKATDVLVWFRFRNIFSSPELAVVDFWCGRNGSVSVTVTTRSADLPAWFELHPTEMVDALVRRMSARVQAGQCPDEPIEAPNLWKVLAGDRVVFCKDADLPKPVSRLLLLEFRENAAVFADPGSKTTEEFIAFGAPPTEGEAETVHAAQVAAEIVCRTGPPREIATEWALSR